MHEWLKCLLILLNCLSLGVLHSACRWKPHQFRRRKAKTNSVLGGCNPKRKYRGLTESWINKILFVFSKFNGLISVCFHNYDQGVKLELCCEDRVGLLSDVTRIFRENGLSVSRAEVTTRGSQAVNVFYVTDSSGNPVCSQMIEAVRNEIGQTILQVKDEANPNSSTENTGKFSFGSLFRSRSEKILHNLGLIRSSSRDSFPLN